MAPIDFRYFSVKYLLEFFIVVLGITVSFWLSEWNEDRKLAIYNVDDAYDLLEDLNHDKERLDQITEQIIQGLDKSSRLVMNIESHRSGAMSYIEFADTLMEIGYVYEYGTFFMNNATYKSVLQNGRLHNFPSDLEKQIKDYYEYVSKRVEDNNRLVDNITANYYSKHHPLCERNMIDYLPLTNDKTLELYFLHDMKDNYSSLDFYKTTMSLMARIKMHGDQVKQYQNMRNNIDSLLRGHVGLEPMPL